MNEANKQQAVGGDQEPVAASLKVPLADLRRRLHRRRVVELSTCVEDVRVNDTEVSATASVEVEVTLEAVPDGVTVTGRVAATWSGPCHLCLTEVRGPLVAAVKELCADHPVDDEVYPLHAEYVDLEPVVTDALRLELPLIARCPNGGVGSCELAPDALSLSNLAGSQGSLPGDPRWAALDSLTFDDE